MKGHTTFYKWPWARERFEYSVEGGVPTQFTVQLEYAREATPTGPIPDTWDWVARFDHSSGGPHDWEEEGPHMDISHPDRDRYVDDFPPEVPVVKGPEFAQQFLRSEWLELCTQYERWYGIEEKKGVKIATQTTGP